MYMNAWLMDFVIPQGKYYIADASFAVCGDTLLVPYWAVLLCSDWV